ncbi:MAG: hypothetical protein AB7P52_03965 [Alphaproteobacteria bacterium]
MISIRPIAAASAAMLGGLALSACATVMEGSSQSIAIATTPSGATCHVERESEQLGAVAGTPGSLHIEKSKNDITVTCAKPGFETARVSYSPEFVGTTFGNILLGGGIGAIIDASTGANYVYPTEVSLTLAPEEPATSSSEP